MVFLMERNEATLKYIAFVLSNQGSYSNVHNLSDVLKVNVLCNPTLIFYLQQAGKNLQHITHIQTYFTVQL